MRARLGSRCTAEPHAIPNAFQMIADRRAAGSSFARLLEQHLIITLHWPEKFEFGGHFYLGARRLLIVGSAGNLSTNFLVNSAAWEGATPLPKGLDSLDYITWFTGMTRSPDHGQGCKFRRCQAEQKIPVKAVPAPAGLSRVS